VSQTFLHIMEDLENRDLTEESKYLEKARALAARKEAFGKDFELSRLGV
jgi:hypothetical protein